MMEMAFKLSKDHLIQFPNFYITEWKNTFMSREGLMLLIYKDFLKSK